MPDKVYYRKALVRNPVFVRGAPVPFEHLSGNVGVAAFDSEKDAALIAGLNELIAKARGGVSMISAEIYDDLKKKRSLATSGPLSSGQPAYRVMPSAASFKPPSPLPKRAAAAPVAGGAESASPPTPAPTAPSAPPAITAPHVKAGAAPASTAAPSTPAIPKNPFRPRTAPTADAGPPPG